MAQTLQPATGLNDADLLRQVNKLRKADNWTNWIPHQPRTHPTVLDLMTQPPPVY